MRIHLKFMTRRQIGMVGLASTFVFVAGLFVHSLAIAVGGAVVSAGIIIYGLITY